MLLKFLSVVERVGRVTSECAVGEELGPVRYSALVST